MKFGEREEALDESKNMMAESEVKDKTQAWKLEKLNSGPSLIIIIIIIVMIIIIVIIIILVSFSKH